MKLSLFLSLPLFYLQRTSPQPPTCFFLLLLFLLLIIITVSKYFKMTLPDHVGPTLVVNLYSIFNLSVNISENWNLSSNFFKYGNFFFFFLRIIQIPANLYFQNNEIKGYETAYCFTQQSLLKTAIRTLLTSLPFCLNSSHTAKMTKTKEDNKLSKEKRKKKKRSSNLV